MRQTREAPGRGTISGVEGPVKKLHADDSYERIIVVGRGVQDVPVRLSYEGFRGVIRKVIPFWSHALYWSRKDSVLVTPGGTFDGPSSERKERDLATQTKEAVPDLKSALRL
ncbi:MAG: hypothetical protein ABI563_03410 [Specibacter sp.]